MKEIKRLIVLANNFDSKASRPSKGEYGGKGKFELPTNHIAAIEVPEGGSCCANCKCVDAENHECMNKYYIEWNGGNSKLPDLPLNKICSDWYEPEKK